MDDTRGNGPRTFRVLEIFPNWAAAEGGIKAGDGITTVDARPCSLMTLSGLNDTLECP